MLFLKNNYFVGNLQYEQKETKWGGVSMSNFNNILNIL